MKLKAIFLALAVAGAGASFALADDGHNAGSTTSTAATTGSTTTTQDCRRFHLRGTLVSVGASSFTINALKGNHAAPGAAGSPVVIAFNADTRVVWAGRGLLSGPNPGDYAWVNGKQCGGDSGALTARSALFSTPPKHHGEAHTQVTAGSGPAAAGPDLVSSGGGPAGPSSCACGWRDASATVEGCAARPDNPAFARPFSASPPLNSSPPVREAVLLGQVGHSASRA